MKTPIFAMAVLLCVILTPGKLRAQNSGEQLTAAEVTQIIAQAAADAAWRNPGAIIAVTDREGFVLGVWDMQGRIPSPLSPFKAAGPDNDLDGNNTTALRNYGLFAGAITRAGTAAFLSSDQEALTSRTAGYIIQQHFPPGVTNTAPGPLVGVGFSNLFFSDINRLKQIANPISPSVPFDPSDLRDPSAPGAMLRRSPGIRGNGVLFGSLNDSPGGVPLYKNGHLVGAIGVTGDGTPTNLAPAAAIFLNETNTTSTPGFVANAVIDVDEQVALAGQRGFRPSPYIVGTNVLINGIRIPYVWQAVENIVDAMGSIPLGSLPGRIVDGFPIQAPPPPFPYPVIQLGGVTGEIRGPANFEPAAGSAGTIHFIDDPVSAMPGRQFIGGQGRLTAAEVTQIITKAAQRANITRAGIRLPLGTSAKVFIAVVNNPDKDLEAPAVLGTFRVGEATMFSWDVAVQKARTAVFFSNSQLAMSTRAIGFLAQSNFPPGIDGKAWGPLFGFQEAVSLKRLPGPAPFPGNLNLPNGITIFPGGFPLYRNGVLVGAIGVSGDGVDQDDIIAASGCADFLAYSNIRADTYAYGGARLPYAKFPRNPVVAVDAAISPDPVPVAPDVDSSAVVRFSSRDVSGDGIADILFQNASGQIAVWYMNGKGTASGFDTLYSGSLGDWKIAGVADLNGDGHADILFQNTIGQITVWYMDGKGSASGSAYIYGGSLGSWRVVGVADMNGDGHADILFQNTIGQIAVWYLDGKGSLSGYASIFGGGLGDWRIVSVADMDGDGNADILFQNTTGQIYVWHMDGKGSISSSAYLYGGGLADWRVLNAVDMNGDGNADLVFQNTVGQIAVWYMDGKGATSGSAYIYSGGLGDWRLR
jgi:uncharacterized protein GlcG (DUF336 family)